MHFYIIMLFPLTAILQLINLQLHIFSLLINAVIFLLNCLVSVLYLYMHFLSPRCYFFLLKHYLDLYISHTALKVSRSLHCFTTSVCHGVENYFPRLWGMGISDAIFSLLINTVIFLLNCHG